MPRHNGGGGGRRAGASHGGGTGQEQAREVKISKAASYVLRHGATKEGLQLDERGFLNVGELLNWPRLASLRVTFPEILSMVQTNEKQRFALIPLPTPPPPQSPSQSQPQPTPFPDPLNPAHHLIRATQGHSIPIQNENLLTPIQATDADCPTHAVHGTYEKRWDLILKSGGLRPMTRQHVHFAPGVLPVPAQGSSSSTDRSLPPSSPQQKPQQQQQQRQQQPQQPQQRLPISPPENPPPKILSGMRQDATVLVWVDVRRSLLQGGLKWWRSANGVLLTEGDEEDGKVGLEWIVLVEKRGAGVIWRGNGGGGDGGEGDGVRS